MMDHEHKPVMKPRAAALGMGMSAGVTDMPRQMTVISQALSPPSARRSFDLSMQSKDFCICPR